MLFLFYIFSFVLLLSPCLCFFFFFLASLGLHCCMQLSLSCSQRGLLLQLWCAGFSLWTCGLSSCVTQAWLPHGMQDPPGPRIKPTYPALASGFLTPGPPGMSTLLISICLIHQILMQNSPLWLWFL